MKKHETTIVPDTPDTATTASEALLGAKETSPISPQGDSLIQVSVAQPTLVPYEPILPFAQQAMEAANAALAVIQNSDASVWPAIGEVIIEPTVIIAPGAPRIRILPRNDE